MIDISPDDKEAFARNGAVIIRGAFSRRWLDIVEQGISDNIASPSDHGRYTDPDTKTFFQDSDNWRRIKPFQDFVFHSPAKEIAAALMGSSKINFLHDHVLSKQPGDCLVFHGLTLHGAAGNLTPLPRRVLSTRWTGDDAVFRRRSGKMSPPEPARGGPQNGGVLDCPAFPVVWRDAGR